MGLVGPEFECPFVGVNTFYAGFCEFCATESGMIEYPFSDPPHRQSAVSVP